jgi:hypothetical protein
MKASRTRHFGWRQYPEDIAESIRALMAYLRDRPPRRCLYPKSIKMASRVLGLTAKLVGSRAYWHLHPVKHRERLEAAGIDPDTLEVVDHNRYALLWQQLTLTGRFDLAQQQADIALGVVGPEPVPFQRLFNADGDLESFLPTSDVTLEMGGFKAKGTLSIPQEAMTERAKERERRQLEKRAKAARLKSRDTDTLPFE